MKKLRVLFLSLLLIVCVLFATSCDNIKFDLENMHIWNTGECRLCGEICEHLEWENSECKKCGINCNEHTFIEEGYCSLCKTECAHDYVDSICTICGNSCTHEWDSGACSICDKLCVHSWSDGICTVCATACSHNYTDSICDICGTICVEHEWESGVCLECEKICIHEWESGICTVCATACSHSYTDSVCDICGTICVEHEWDDGICLECGKICEHSFADGICTICYFGCPHYEYENTLCTACGKACSHNFIDGVCKICDYGCEHIYTDSICTICGVTCTVHEWQDGECIECDKICEHSFVDGICSICTSECQHEFALGVCKVCSVDEPYKFTFTISSDGTYYTLTNVAGTHAEVVVPSEYEGLPVKRISRDAFKYRSGITSLTIPNSVTYIEYHSFQNLTRLVELSVPFIGEDPSGTSRYPLAWMFGGDAKIFCTQVMQTYYTNYSRRNTGTIGGYIPNSLKKITVTGGGTIHRGAFQNCPNIEEIYLYTRSIEEYALDNLASLKVLEISSAESDMGSYTCYANKTDIFKNLKALEVLKIGKNVYAPISSFSLCEIDSVYYDNLSAFFWLNNSTSTSIMEFTDKLFIANEQLSGEVVIPDIITYIPAYAFKDGGAITSLVLHDGITNIGTGAFSGLDISLFTESKNAYYIGTQNNPYMVLLKIKDNSVTSFEFEDGVAFIMENAFVGTPLDTISVPSSVICMAKGALSGLDSLTSVTLPFIGNDITSSQNESIIYVFGDTFPEGITELTILGGESIYSENFGNYCENINSITFGEGVVNLGTYVFQRFMDELIYVSLPSSLKTISENNFTSNKKISRLELTSLDSLLNIECIENLLSEAEEVTINGERLSGEIVIPQGTATIPPYAFANCTDITKITVSSSVTEIGAYAFEGIDAEIVFEEGEERLYITARAFSGYLGTDILLPERTGSLSNYAFADAPNVERLVIPYISTGTIGQYFNTNYVAGWHSNYNMNTDVTYYVPPTIKEITVLRGTTVPDYYFSGLYYVEKISIPDTITKIGKSAFSYCHALEKLDLPYGLTTIGEYAFNSCQAITEFVIPETVTSMGVAMFFQCYALEEITLPYIGEKLTNYGNRGWSHYPLGWHFSTPTSTYGDVTCQYYHEYSVNMRDFNWVYKGFYVPASLKKVTILGGDIMYGQLSGLKTATEIVLGANVKYIEEMGLYNSQALKSIDLGGVTSIGEEAFASCKALENITLPATLKTIGDSAFMGSGLKEITIPATVTTVGASAFENCTSLDRAVIGAVSEIKKNAFYGCTALETVVLGKIKKIGNAVFPYDTCTCGADKFPCAHRLQIDKLYYEGTEAQWNTLISKTEANYGFVDYYYYSTYAPTAEGNYWHYDTDGNIVEWPPYAAE